MVGSGMAGIFYYPFVLETDKVHLIFEVYLCFFGGVILFLAGPCRFASAVRLDSWGHHAGRFVCRHRNAPSPPAPLLSFPPSPARFFTTKRKHVYFYAKFLFEPVFRAKKQVASVTGPLHVPYVSRCPLRVPYESKFVCPS